MKRIIIICCIVFPIIHCGMFLNAEGVFPQENTRSILGEDRNAIFSIFSFSEDQKVDIEKTENISEAKYNLGDLPSETAPGRAGNELLKFLDEKKIITYSKDEWKIMRDTLEGGGVPGVSDVFLSTVAIPVQPPMAPGLSLDLPYESQLYISGRKLIGVSFKSTIYDKPESLKRVNSSSFDMSQELQVRIKGRVGTKINVNVDFDDTRVDKRDISVVYKGDPEEVVQEAAFGDITMSLPSTEFAGYSRQLFGVKVHTKYKKLKSWGFFSRTKGFSEIKRFTGNTKFERKTISDTSYIGLKYYLLKFNNDLIKNGSVKVYRDDRNPNNNNINTSTNTAVEAMGPPASTFTGSFDLLVAGQDYTVDYERGILVFRNRVGVNHVVAVDYENTNGTFLRQNGSVPGVPKIIKDESNSAAISKELKTFYNLGDVKIIRDDGRGNFILQIQDLNGTPPAVIRAGNPVPQYPANITVDFENGVFNFEPPTSRPFADDLYTINAHRYNILTEYRHRIKFIILRPGIVPQSENVTMNGQVIKADVDYFIDYDAGIVTFLREDNINENTVIEVAYDYAPFGGVGGSTLVGLRSELSLTNNIFLGSSFIYDFASKTQSIPDIRTTPSSLMVWEADSRVQNIKIPLTPITMSFGGEYALSQQNTNIMNKAILESMEGIKQEDSSSVYYESWKPASNPGGGQYYIRDISWVNEDVSRMAINPSLKLETSETQQVLNIAYDLGTSQELSIIQNLSNVGLDYTKKLYLEMWIHGDGKGESLGIAYGSFNEDSDGDGILDNEDMNNDGTLNQGEDIGFEFTNPDGTISRHGVDNGRIDTEDLDSNGVLNSIDNAAAPGSYGIGNGKTAIDSNGTSYSAITWTGWKLFKIPLEITQPDDWKAIKQIRLTIQGTGSQKGNIKIANISVVGNKWETIPVTVVGSTITVSAIDNEINPDYVSLVTYPDYLELYDIQTGVDLTEKKEQALSMKYEVPGSTSAVLTAKLTYGRAYDLANYKFLKLFVYGNGQVEDKFFIQAGNDLNYFEYSVPVYWTGWRLITITQEDLNKDGIPERWISTDPGANTTVFGSPSLQNISQLKIGVIAQGGKKGEIWVNEIHMAESLKKNGFAWRANADFNVPNWSTFGMKRKQNNRDFQTFSAGVYNRDYLEDTAYLNLSRISAIPINTNLSRTVAVTPSVVQTQGDLVSILEEGRVVTYSGSGSSSFSYGGLPKLGMQFKRSIIDSQQIKRLEDRETLSGTLDYSNPVRFNIFPTAVSANYSLANSFFRPWIKVDESLTDSSEFLGINALNEYLEIKEFQSLEISEIWGGKTPFIFWNGFNFTPGYSMSTVREKSNLFEPQLEFKKSMNQNVNANSSLQIFNWLKPTFSYNINSKENYNLNYSTSSNPIMYPSKNKFIERSSNGELAWNFQVKDIIENRYTQSLGFSMSYRIQDSDSYDNIASSFSIRDVEKLWIRNTPLFNDLGSGTTDSYTVKSINTKDDVRVAGRFNPFEAFNFAGRLSPIKTLSSNFTYTWNEEHSLITGTKRDAFTKVWPDLIFGLNKLEQMIWLERWVHDSQLNIKHQKKLTETANVSFSENKIYGTDFRFNLVKKVDLNIGVNSNRLVNYDLTKFLITQEGNTISWSTQAGFNLKQWRFTMRYERSQDSQKDGTGKLTTDVIANNYTGQIYSDLSFPRGLPVPFFNRTLPLNNRLIVNSSLKYSTRASSLNVERDNTSNYGISSNAEYEVSSNFRLSVGLGWSRLVNHVKSDENYSTIEASSRLTIQF